MQQCAPIMMLKYSNLLEPPYQKKLVKSIKIKLNYIGLMVCQSSERKVVFSLKKLQRLFKECNFEIIAESNKKIVNDLDVTLNLKPGSFRPYHNLMAKCNTYIQNPITCQTLLSKYQSPQKIVYQTFLGRYSKNQQHFMKINCSSVDTVRN